MSSYIITLLFLFLVSLPIISIIKGTFYGTVKSTNYNDYHSLIFKSSDKKVFYDLFIVHCFLNPYSKYIRIDKGRWAGDESEMDIPIWFASYIVWILLSGLISLLFFLLFIMFPLIGISIALVVSAAIFFLKYAKKKEES